MREVQPAILWAWKEHTKLASRIRGNTREILLSQLIFVITSLWLDFFSGQWVQQQHTFLFWLYQFIRRQNIFDQGNDARRTFTWNNELIHVSNFLYIDTWLVSRFVKLAVVGLKPNHIIFVFFFREGLVHSLSTLNKWHRYITASLMC